MYSIYTNINVLRNIKSSNLEIIGKKEITENTSAQIIY